MSTENLQIGVMAAGHVYCIEGCIPSKFRPIRVYRDNIGDYKQSCAKCGKILVEGKTPAWPELFAAPAKNIQS